MLYRENGQFKSSYRADLGLTGDCKRLVRPLYRVAGQPRGPLIVGQVGQLKTFVEAGGTLLIQRAAIKAAADRLGVSVIGLSNG